MRQQGREQSTFRDTLSRVRIKEPTQVDWVLLTSRCRISLLITKRENFLSTIRIYAKRREVS